MQRYEYIPNGFGVGLTIPIPKGDTQKLKCNTDDYRGITISPVISKLFEHCILIQNENFLNSADYQFGFKKKTGVNHAIYSVRKTVEYFIERDSTVNLCALDLSKAFDKMNRFALFIKLMKRNCPILLINVLDCWYAKSVTCVKWGSTLSRYVDLTAGVRQGGVVSPVLFAVFINDVLVQLQDSNLGCYIKNIAFNCFMYADDLLLLSISVCDMQRMINICKAELDWLDMTINISKTFCLRIGNRYKCKVANIIIDNNVICWSEEIRYLGVYIMSNKVFKCNLHQAKIKYFRSLNGILGKIGTSTALNVSLSLVSSFSTPVLLYGFDSGCLSKSQIDKLNYPFNSIYCKLFSTFDKNVITQCQYFTGQLPLKYVLDLRFIIFLLSLQHVKNSPPYMLANWFEDVERHYFANEYDITVNDRSTACRNKMWNVFKRQIAVLY